MICIPKFGKVIEVCIQHFKVWVCVCWGGGGISCFMDNLGFFGFRKTLS